MEQVRAQATSRESRTCAKNGGTLGFHEGKRKEVLDLQIALTNANERILREAEKNHQRELELFAETKEIRRQRTEFKEMADEFMLKWRIVEEQKQQLTNSYRACKNKRA